MSPSPSPRSGYLTSREAAAVESYAGRGYDVARVVSRNADNTYRVNVLSRTDASGADADYLAVACADPGSMVFQADDYVLLGRLQGRASRPVIIGQAPSTSGGTSRSVWF